MFLNDRDIETNSTIINEVPYFVGVTSRLSRKSVSLTPLSFFMSTVLY